MLELWVTCRQSRAECIISCITAVMREVGECRDMTSWQSVRVSGFAYAANAYEYYEHLPCDVELLTEVLIESQLTWHLLGLSLS